MDEPGACYEFREHPKYRQNYTKKSQVIQVRHLYIVEDSFTGESVGSPGHGIEQDAGSDSVDTGPHPGEQRPLIRQILSGERLPFRYFMPPSQVPDFLRSNEKRIGNKGDREANTPDDDHRVGRSPGGEDSLPDHPTIIEELLGAQDEGQTPQSDQGEPEDLRSRSLLTRSSGHKSPCPLDHETDGDQPNSCPYPGEQRPLVSQVLPDLSVTLGTISFLALTEKSQSFLSKKPH